MILFGYTLCVLNLSFLVVNFVVFFVSITDSVYPLVQILKI